MDPDPDISDPDQKNWNRISGKKDPDPKHSMKGSVAELELVWAALAPEVRGLEPTPVPTTPAPGKKGRSRWLRLHKLKFLSF